MWWYILGASLFLYMLLFAPGTYSWQATARDGSASLRLRFSSLFSTDSSSVTFKQWLAHAEAISGYEMEMPIVTVSTGAVEMIKCKVNIGVIHFFGLELRSISVKIPKAAAKPVEAPSSDEHV